MTPTAVFPPPPNAASYSGSALNLFTVNNGPSATFDETQPYKTWQAPTGWIPPGMTAAPSPSTDIILYHWDAEGNQQPFVCSYAQALAPANVAPSGASAAQIALWQAAPYGMQALPVPVRQLLPTESVTEALGIITVTNSAYVAPNAPPPTGDATEARILAGVEEELAKDGLPPV